MKLLSKDDLRLLIDLCSNQSFSVNEVDYLLNTYGDDWFIEGDKFVKTRENARMMELREACKKEKTT